MADNSADVQRMQVRRSTRSKRKPGEWKQQLNLTVRSTRATEDTEMLPVASLGGQPSHKHSNTIVDMTAKAAVSNVTTSPAKPAVSNVTVSPAKSATAKTSGRPYTKRRFRSG